MGPVAVAVAIAIATTIETTTTARPTNEKTAVIYYRNAKINDSWNVCNINILLQKWNIKELLQSNDMIIKKNISNNKW